MQENHKLKNENAFIKVGQILTIVAAVFWCFTIIGALWGVPMIIGTLNRLSGKKPITIGHIVIAIIFFWPVGGVLTLVGAHQEKLI